MQKPQDTLLLLIAGVMLALAAGVAIGSAAYVVSPIDAVPDFIPIAGQLDDVVVGGGGLALLAALYAAAKRVGMIERIEELIREEGDE